MRGSGPHLLAAALPVAAGLAGQLHGRRRLQRCVIRMPAQEQRFNATHALFHASRAPASASLTCVMWCGGRTWGESTWSWVSAAVGQGWAS